MSQLFHSGNLSGKFYDWSAACPKCKNICNAGNYRCENCSAANCYVDAAPARIGRGVAVGDTVVVSSGSAAHTWVVCNTCHAQQATMRCPTPYCGLDLKGVVYKQYEYLKNIPLIYAGMMLAVLGGLAVLLVVLFVSWGIWHQRGINQQAAEEANSKAPIPVPLAKTHQGDFQVFQASELESAGAGSYQRGIDLEGKVLIQGDLKHIVVRSTRALITLNGNASDCEFRLGPGSTFDGEDLSHSTLYIRGEGTARVRNLSRESGIHVKHFTVQNAADGQISSKDLRVTGAISPQVKLLKGVWQ